MTFSDLLRRFRGDAQRNGPAGEALCRMLASSQLQCWSEEEPPPAEGVRLLLLVATWSLYDLQLLDTLNKRMGIDRVRVEPVLGVWRDGVLTERLWGWPAIAARRGVYTSRHPPTWPFRKNGVAFNRSLKPFFASAAATPPIASGRWPHVHRHHTHPSNCVHVWTSPDSICGNCRCQHGPLWPSKPGRFTNSWLLGVPTSLILSWFLLNQVGC